MASSGDEDTDSADESKSLASPTSPMATSDGIDLLEIP